MSKKKTMQEWQELSNKIHNYEFIIMEEPKNRKEKINILHRECGNIISTNMGNHLYNYCKYCSNTPRSIEMWQKMCDEIHNYKFEILQSPNTSVEKVNVLHKKCGKISSMTMNSLVLHKNSCYNCTPNSKKNLEHWIKKSELLYSSDYKILEEPKNSRQKVDIIHNICGKIHKKSMDAFLFHKRGCPFCANKNSKYAENYIEKFLIENGILYEKEKTFDDLKNPKTNRHLRIDFWIESLNVGLEIMGRQHYELIPHWNNENDLKESKYRDEIKKNYFEIKKKILIYIKTNQLSIMPDIWENLIKKATFIEKN
jgi:hypothetical protein